MDRANLESLVNQGLTTRQIAATLEMSQTNVRHWLRKHDLKTRRGPKGKIADEDLTYKCKCGETDPDNFYGTKRFVCGACHNKYVIERGLEKRKRAVAHLGGKCVDCGFDKHIAAMDIHHTDPTIKDEGFASYRGWSWERLEKELQSCVLLCRNCHAIRHAG